MESEPWVPRTLAPTKLHASVANNRQPVKNLMNLICGMCARVRRPGTLGGTGRATPPNETKKM